MNEITTVIYDIVESFLLALGLNPSHVRSVRIGPNQIDLELYALNEDGAKHVDLSTGDPAVVKRQMLISRSRQR